MTPRQLKKLEAELARRGYRKYTTGLTSRESWAWFKKFNPNPSDTDNGYQVAFRVWDYTTYSCTGAESYGFDFWASPINTDGRIDIEANWEPFANIDTFEAIAKDFFQLTMKYFDQ